MQIVDPGLKFTNKFTARRKTERIVIHHAAVTGMFAANWCIQWHLGRGGWASDTIPNQDKWS